MWREQWLAKQHFHWPVYPLLPGAHEVCSLHITTWSAAVKKCDYCCWYKHFQRSSPLFLPIQYLTPRDGEGSTRGFSTTTCPLPSRASSQPAILYRAGIVPSHERYRYRPHLFLLDFHKNKRITRGIITARKIGLFLSTPFSSTVISGIINSNISPLLFFSLLIRLLDDAGSNIFFRCWLSWISLRGEKSPVLRDDKCSCCIGDKWKIRKQKFNEIKSTNN